MNDELIQEAVVTATRANYNNEQGHAPSDSPAKLHEDALGNVEVISGNGEGTDNLAARVPQGHQVHDGILSTLALGR